jgi:hypothetical protein
MGVRERSGQGVFWGGLGVRGIRGKERRFCIWFEFHSNKTWPLIRIKDAWFENKGFDGLWFFREEIMRMIKEINFKGTQGEMYIRIGTIQMRICKEEVQEEFWKSGVYV